MSGIRPLPAANAGRSSRPLLWWQLRQSGSSRITMVGLVVLATFAALLASPATASAAPSPVTSCQSWVASQAADGSRAFGISWPASGDPTLEHVVERQIPDRSSSWNWRAKLVDGPWIDAGSDPSDGSAVNYRIKTKQAGEFGPVTNCTSTDTARPATPAAPALVGPATTDRVELSLTHNGDNRAVIAYDLFRNTSNDFGAATLIAVTPALTVTTTAQVVDADIVAGSTYFYWLKVRDGAGNSSWRSGELRVAIPAPAPAPPRCPASSTGSATGLWHTEALCDRWHLIDPSGDVVVWQAVNLQAQKSKATIGGQSANSIDAVDIANLADRFPYVRLNLAWEDMQPGNGSSTPQLDPSRVEDILTLLGWLESNDVGVILDVMHLGDSARQFWIPNWAWKQADDEQAVDLSDKKANQSWYTWASNDGARTKQYLTKLATSGILAHSAVVAVEVVNEPHPRPGIGGATTAQAQNELADVYSSLSTHIQDLQAQNDADTRLVVLGAYHGGTRFGGDYTSASGTTAVANGGYPYNHARTVLTERDGLDDLVWTAHNYYHGRGDGEGRNDGQRDNGARGEGLWGDSAFESGEGAGCYTTVGSDASNAWSCDETAGPGWIGDAHARNARGHDDYAQAASMPFFMGEWGITRQRRISGEYRGWGNANQFFCDKLDAYADVDGEGTAISSAVWSFNAFVDGYGIYNAKNSRSPNDDRVEALAPNTWTDRSSNNHPLAVRGDAWDNNSWTYAAAFDNQQSCRR